MSERMYKQMRATLRDIKRETNSLLSSAEKVDNIQSIIALLELLENGEVITSDITDDKDKDVWQICCKYEGD